ncbi:hypothetical protein SQ03_06075 [Methylobacterium platani JCM 14648]|uniref:Uncharacterized protein n=2 Tax=Methylobacterium platani TaxID=427683 RepID=A0A179S9U1_9HYPH|nr:hypothetical protein SQ03_06075 [Methylobacterium platani JCM 14648]OAS24098.1 hypothetical protein A5481_15155 [Methylobacterium platani]
MGEHQPRDDLGLDDLGEVVAPARLPMYSPGVQGQRRPVPKSPLAAGRQIAGQGTGLCLISHRHLPDAQENRAFSMVCRLFYIGSVVTVTA